MKYLRTYCCLAAVLSFSSPASAAGNALAGGWTGTMGSGSLQIGGTAGTPSTAPVPASGVQASASASAAPSSGLASFEFSLGGGGQNVGASGPEAGAGLSFLLLAGVYVLRRRRRATALVPCRL